MLVHSRANTKAIAKKQAELLKALSNPSRIKVVEAIRNGERHVGELCEISGLSQSALSQHLAKLRAAKIVATRRDAQTIYYRLNSPAVEKVLASLESIFLGDDEAEAA